MTIEELRSKLQEVLDLGDSDLESRHIDKDSLLLEYINDAEVTRIYDEIGGWYA